MAHRALSEAWSAGRAAFGGWVSLPSEFNVDAFVGAGYDYVGIDCQHSLIDEALAARMVAARPNCAAALIVRVARNDPGLIGRVLDAGADGVIVPLVNTAEQAAAAVAACRYAPQGYRSFGPVRPDLGRDPRSIESRALCFVMIETAEAVRNAAAICGTKGVDGIYVGPADLAVTLGLPPGERPMRPALREAVTAIRQAAQAAGVIPGFHAGNGKAAAELAAEGYRLLTLGVDRGLLAMTARDDLKAAKGG
jgi:4-hydroxy-2-oxoheptanedioate aldolase